MQEDFRFAVPVSEDQFHRQKFAVVEAGVRGTLFHQEIKSLSACATAIRQGEL